MNWKVFAISGGLTLASMTGCDVSHAKSAHLTAVRPLGLRTFCGNGMQAVDWTAPPGSGYLVTISVDNQTVQQWPMPVTPQGRTWTSGLFTTTGQEVTVTADGVTDSSALTAC